MEEIRINVKAKLSALWCVLMSFYAYADILGFYAPGKLAEILTSEIACVSYEVFK